MLLSGVRQLKSVSAQRRLQRGDKGPKESSPEDDLHTKNLWVLQFYTINIYCFWRVWSDSDVLKWFVSSVCDCWSFEDPFMFCVLFIFVLGLWEAPVHSFCTIRCDTNTVELNLRDHHMTMRRLLIKQGPKWLAGSCAPTHPTHQPLAATPRPPQDLSISRSACWSWTEASVTICWKLLTHFIIRCENLPKILSEVLYKSVSIYEIQRDVDFSHVVLQRGAWLPSDASIHLLLATPASSVPRDTSLDLAFSPQRVLLRIIHPLKTILIQGPFRWNPENTLLSFWI